MNFGEKKMEYSPKQGREIPVWQSPRYLESRAKAEEIINSNKYDVKPSDFWILMNETKSGKMAYTGLIISHNGCLKINDHLESKFEPSCVSVDKSGFHDSLVYTYIHPGQGLYEVGEVSAKNCKNEYPYAMAYKRLFDRVVLKLSKLAYAGIYSDSEADEFQQKQDTDTMEESPENAPTAANELVTCSGCDCLIQPTRTRRGEMWPVNDIVAYSRKRFGAVLCPSCQNEVAKAEKEAAKAQ